MFRNILVIIVLAVMSVFYIGCKKSSNDIDSEPNQTENVQEKIRTIDAYEAEATEQINKENMAEELAKIEKELRQEVDPDILEKIDNTPRTNPVPADR